MDRPSGTATGKVVRGIQVPSIVTPSSNRDRVSQDEIKEAKDDFSLVEKSLGKEYSFIRTSEDWFGVKPEELNRKTLSAFREILKSFAKGKGQA